MLRSRNKLTGESKSHVPEKESKVPDPKEGDCRVCAFYTPPVSTGQSEDWRLITDSWRMRPCGQNACIGKKFMTRDELKKLQEKIRRDRPDPDPGKGESKDGKRIVELTDQIKELEAEKGQNAADGKAALDSRDDEIAELKAMLKKAKAVKK